tara:strand:- start:104 stop:304 length:201 start_codon:yes stop_codon:yes gene_type:complete
MYSNYLFIGVCAVSGSLIYNAVGNLLLKPNIYEGRKDIINFGMLMGLTLSSGYFILKSEGCFYKKN